ncbi:hypothetical protein TevJSym_ag01140 [endosymbiont of Tevnia jerichonana (vent Tica)]|uniref:Uncharacterized protein n=1 Tax=endosymbiont of Tevnia jerichonana (vent Tica) TaxID=1049564 RepID=G2FE52_9GAMM|nr:hypothetical protein TevJSym_ag01140 [endosymbiont of Tevnia jerichonana (vent Tica)]
MSAIWSVAERKSLFDAKRSVQIPLVQTMTMIDIHPVARDLDISLGSRL